MNSYKPIILEIKLLSNLIKRKIDRTNDEGKTEVVTGMQGFVIGYLSHNADTDVFQKDIEMEFEIRRSTATGILQLMEKNKLIERHPVSHDARLKKIVLTKKGAKHHHNFLDSMEKVEKGAEKGLTKEEIETFFRIAHKIKKNLEEEA